MLTRRAEQPHFVDAELHADVADQALGTLRAP